MRSLNVVADGHQIEIKYSIWNGKEQVFFDGQLVSEKRSFQYVTAHIIPRTENGTSVIYEVDVLTGISGRTGYVVRRNGIALACEP